MMYRKLSLMVAVLGLAAAACGGATSANQVRVSATEGPDGQAFTSDVTTFKAGETYHFVVENAGALQHEFMIIEPVEPGMMEMEEMDEMAMYVVEEEDLAPGATVEFDYTFPSDAVGQPLEFACHLPGHYEDGMHLTINVEA